MAPTSKTSKTSKKSTSPIKKTSKTAISKMNRVPVVGSGDHRRKDWMNWNKNDFIDWVREFWRNDNDIEILWKKQVDGQILEKLIQYQMTIRANRKLGQTVRVPACPVKFLSEAFYEVVCEFFWSMVLHSLKKINSAARHG